MLLVVMHRRLKIITPSYTTVVVAVVCKTILMKIKI